jgi:tRNA(fMet)-specific endonuclease VapC
MAMTEYLLDTHHAGVLLRDISAPLRAQLAGFSRAECRLCRAVVAELWFMVLNSAQVAANTARLRTLLRQFDVWEFDERAAIEFGHLRVELRRQGTPLPMMDVLIASIARSRNLTLLSKDQHFAAVPRLERANWLA